MKRILYLTPIIFFTWIVCFCSCTHEVIIPEHLKRPIWMDKYPYIGNNDIFEQKGVAENDPNFSTKRRNAIKDAIETMALLMNPRVTVLTTSYSSSFRDYYKDSGSSTQLSENGARIYNDELFKRVQLAGEWEAPLTNRYWVYIYISPAAQEASFLEAKKQEAIDQELITRNQRDAFFND